MYGNTFDITLVTPYKVLIRRTDNPGASWAGSCSTSCNAKIITIPRDIYWCPGRVDKSNWVTTDTWDNVFEGLAREEIMTTEFF
eukprot:g13169.t1